MSGRWTIASTTADARAAVTPGCSRPMTRIQRSGLGRGGVEHGEHIRHEDLVRRREEEIRREHADDLPRAVLERDAAAHDGGIAAESLRPEAMRQHDLAIARAGIVEARLPERRPHAEDLEKVGRDQRLPQHLRFVAQERQRREAPAVAARVGEGPALGANARELGGREPIARDHHDAIRIDVRERTQPDAVDDRERERRDAPTRRRAWRPRRA